MPISAEQQEYMRRNTVKPADTQQWFTFHFSHVDWSEDLDYVAIEDWRGVEYDWSKYTFDGVQHTPISMSFTLPKESSSENGEVTTNFPRAGSTVKRLMKQITPTNTGVPIVGIMRLWQSGNTSPVWEYSGTVSKDYPKISGNDVSVQISIYNPNLITSNRIVTVTEFPELRNE